MIVEELEAEAGGISSMLKDVVAVEAAAAAAKAEAEAATRKGRWRPALVSARPNVAGAASRTWEQAAVDGSMAQCWDCILQTHACICCCGVSAVRRLCKRRAWVDTADGGGSVGGRLCGSCQCLHHPGNQGLLMLAR